MKWLLLSSVSGWNFVKVGLFLLLLRPHRAKIISYVKG
jgi:hypothetical protein